jgi:folate-dependent phosphoribosylglycinamide formyltransferase PurN
MANEFPIALLVSYRGSTAEAVVRSSLTGVLKEAGVHVDLVVSSSPDVEAFRVVDGIEGMKRGGKIQLPNWRIKNLDPRSGAYASEEAYGEAILALCYRWKIELICLFGWLGPLPGNVREAYSGRILRQFCGPMDPGRRDFFKADLVGPGVHAAVLWYQRTLAGINGVGLKPSTEVVTQLIRRRGDNNPVVGETAVSILPDDNPTTLAERTIALEHKLQIETILRARDGTLVPRRRPNPLIPKRFHNVLDEATAIGRALYPIERHLIPK